MKKILFFIILIFAVHFVLAEFPSPQSKYVNDYADILTSEDEDFLSQYFSIIEENTTAQVVFVSLENIDEGISQYATNLGQEWGVGQEDKDNGVVILYVEDINKIWVATGYGVEGVLPDSKLGRMLDEKYVPYRDNGEISEGIMQFSFALSEEMVKNSEELISGQRNSKWSVIGIIIIIVIIGLVILFVIALSVIVKAIATSTTTGKRNWNRMSRGHSWSGKSSGGGFGGGGFGGGGFGGGGAGR